MVQKRSSVLNIKLSQFSPIISLNLLIGVLLLLLRLLNFFFYWGLDFKVSFINKWYFCFQHPYPSEDQKKQLAQDTGLTILQVNNWWVKKKIAIFLKRKPMLSTHSVVEAEMVGNKRVWKNNENYHYIIFPWPFYSIPYKVCFNCGVDSAKKTWLTNETVEDCDCYF